MEQEEGERREGSRKQRDGAALRGAVERAKHGEERGEKGQEERGGGSERNRARVVFHGSRNLQYHERKPLRH